ncbi:ABC transporter ATP-binding protein [Phycicoccus elongatus]|jgi:ABC-2 type transport system ATP-binding protein|uniref:ABC transporter related n=1 Tax=Phycicoccus elongatus Lp2 TaxID=1193181 RepID=N0DZB0_9MICO|nr:ABC transporter ATP-binding protein [Phycicoccus elongatus]MBK8731107.1 ABC transporter ATP-binding protein [Tetrasphaera sp.]MCA0322293.1 ABC transporter ATP-binding protein [Actinomycetota bacterium]HPF82324.1 ABC transporter ATP-binding protein [Tetrasphaera australiensis]HRY11472.1 ABC transporter ATP-binding protein [Candidatus Nanopelagicales bacterium]CCH69887.1 ABC transporter related [Phycicoccus elongatus Lp2]
MLHTQNQVRPTTDTITDTVADTVVASVESVSKSFGDTVALDDLSMQVHAGESLGLLGPNGAGKSTLISLLTGTRRADTGTVTIFGGDPTSPDSRRRLGVTPQATALPVTLRVREVFAFVGAHFGTTQEHLDELAASFDLADLLEKQCGSLSGGQQRRLMVALALVGDPELVILDEPTTGLDVESRDRLWARLRRYRDEGGTLVITSHYLAEIEALASRVLVVDHGRVIADGTVRQITEQVQLRRILLRTTAPEQQLLALPGTVSVTPESESDPHHVVLATRDADATVRALVADGIDFSDLQVHGASLEEAFLALTTHQSPAHAA